MTWENSVRFVAPFERDTFGIIHEGREGWPTSTRVNSRIMRAAPAALECGREGGRDGGMEVATNCIHYSCSRALFRATPPPRSPRRHCAHLVANGVRLLCMKWLWWMRYEVAGSRKAVRHLDWPVGSYKRREAREDARGRLCRDAGPPARRRCRKLRLSFRRRCVSRRCRRETVWIYDHVLAFRVILAKAELDKEASAHTMGNTVHDSQRSPSEAVMANFLLSLCNISRDDG